MGLDAMSRVSGFVDPGWRLDRDRSEGALPRVTNPIEKVKVANDDQKTGVGAKTTAEDLAAEPDSF
jgi:hypothetical protein